MNKIKTPRRRYQRPTISVYRIDDLWRELGPAQAFTDPYIPCQPPGKRQIPSNPLKIPPNN